MLVTIMENNNIIALIVSIVPALKSAFLLKAEQFGKIKIDSKYIETAHIPRTKVKPTVESMKRVIANCTYDNAIDANNGSSKSSIKFTPVKLFSDVNKRGDADGSIRNCIEKPLSSEKIKAERTVTP